MNSTTKKSFPIGQLMMTARIHEYMNSSTLFYRFVFGCIDRHKIGDWGDVSHHDQETNDIALDHGGRIISSYNLPTASQREISLWLAAAITDESRIWIITDADRKHTTVLFPSDY